MCVSNPALQACDIETLLDTYRADLKLMPRDAGDILAYFTNEVGAGLSLAVSRSCCMICREVAGQVAEKA